MKSTLEIPIGISSCLLGHNVRFDGGHKYNQIIAAQICPQFNCIAICPEYAIGLGVPRKPIHLVKNGKKLRVLGVENPAREFTESLASYADYIVSIYPKLCGYVFKARSPSCGVGDVPVFDTAGNQIDKGSGQYAAQLTLLIPKLPVINETQLSDNKIRQAFLQRVLDYAQTLPALRE